MFQRKPRRFRRHSSGRGQMLRGGKAQPRLGSQSFENGKNRNNFRNLLSAEELFERYISLAKEATSSGDKTLSENYLQHADHFERIVSLKNSNQNENSSQVANVTKVQDKSLSSNSETNQDQISKNKK